MNKLPGTVKAALLAAIMLVSGTAYCDNSSKIRQIDQYFIDNEDEKAVALCDEVLADRSDEQAAMLALYKKAFILEDKLFMMQESLGLYDRFIEQYPASNLLNLAVNSYNNLLELKHYGELDIYAGYKKHLSEFYLDATKRKSRPAKKHAVELYNYAVANKGVSFNEKMFNDTYVVLITVKKYWKANDILKIINEKFPGKEQYKFYDQPIKLNFTRAYIYIAALLADLALVILILSVVIRRKYRLSMPDRHFFIAVSVPVICLGAYYSKFVVYDNSLRFTVLDIAALAVMLFGTISFTYMFRGVLNNIRNRPLRVVSGIFSGLIIGFTGWIIYAYNLDYMWLLTL